MLKLLLIGLALVGSIACQDCYTGVVKYYQCKYFEKLMKQSTKGGVYSQDPMLGSYNVVNEDFIKTQNLTNYTDTASAMGFFQKIYKEMVKNKCFKTQFLDLVPGKYSPIFLKKGYFDAAVEIIAAYKKQLKPYLLTAPPASVGDIWNNYAKMPTLTSFCMQNDYTKSVYEFYNTTAVTCGIDGDQFTEYFYTCTYPLTVVNRKIVTGPNAKQIVQLAQCSLAATKTCTEEARLFWALTDWTDYFTKMSVPATKDKAIAFFKGLTKGDKLPTITFNFSYMYADWNKTSLYLKGFNGTQTGGGLNCSNGHTDTILSTTNDNLVVEGTWTKNADSTCSLSSVTITSLFLFDSLVATKKFNILSPEFKDKTYEKVSAKKKKTNWLFLRSTQSDDGHARTEINELEWNAFFAFEEDHMEAFVDRKLLSEGSGILVDGFDDEDIKPLSAGRRRRDVDDDQNDENVNRCKRQCNNSRRKRWNGPVLGGEKSDSSSGDNDWNSYIVQHATSTSQCVTSCLNEN